MVEPKPKPQPAPAPAPKKSSYEKYIWWMAFVAFLVVPYILPGIIQSCSDEDAEATIDSVAAVVDLSEDITVEGGTFTMGATGEQGSDAEDDATPTHRVKLSDFSIGQTEVTQALWRAVMGSNPSEFKGDNLPVENVSWEDCAGVGGLGLRVKS